MHRPTFAILATLLLSFGCGSATSPPAASGQHVAGTRSPESHTAPAAAVTAPAAATSVPDVSAPEVEAAPGIEAAATVEVELVTRRSEVGQGPAEIDPPRARLPRGSTVHSAYENRDTGERVLLATRPVADRQAPELLAYRLGPTGQTRLFVETPIDCSGADAMAAFIHAPVRFTDHDGDGASEVEIAYLTNCTTDCSGPTVTVRAFENGTEVGHAQGMAGHASAISPETEVEWHFGPATVRTPDANPAGADLGRRLVARWAEVAASYPVCYPGVGFP